MRKFRYVGLALVLLFVLTAVPVMAGANIIQQYADEWEFTWDDNWLVLNECSGEYVHVAGVFHDQLLEVEDANGGHHWVNHWRAVGRGYGVDSLARYVYQGGDQDPANPNHNGGSDIGNTQGLHFSHTSTWYLNLIGQGRAENYLMSCHVHETIDANGEMSVDFGHCMIECH
jgi:hypothetical protein